MKTRFGWLLAVLVLCSWLLVPGVAHAATASGCTWYGLGVTFPPDGVVRPGRYNDFDWDESTSGCNGDGRLLVDLVVVAPNNTYFSNRSWSYNYDEPGGDPCVVMDTANALQVNCVATTNRIYLATFTGRASSVTDNRGKGTVKLLPLAASTATFSYFTP